MPSQLVLAPHGTVAAARRHYRRGETPCDACYEAQRYDRHPNAIPGEKEMDPRPRRNGLPVVPAYRYRTRYYPRAAAAIAAAEAVHGPPVPTCVCGQPVQMATSGYIRRCEKCGRAPSDTV